MGIVQVELHCGVLVVRDGEVLAVVDVVRGLAGWHGFGAAHEVQEARVLPEG